MSKRHAIHDKALGNWIKLQEIEYEDARGVRRTWESAGRRHNHGAAVMIARLRPSGRYILVEQYRPPADSFVIEFPAGIMDPEEAPAATAVRELREETGYHGIVRTGSNPLLGSPGMSTERLHLVLMDVDEALPENQALTTEWDESEHIVTHLVAPADALAFLRDQEAAGRMIDSRVMAYFLGLAAG